jgi:acetylornithine deacetylase/succinyl-diaminopimelate desuccinylase-like protein
MARWRINPFPDKSRENRMKHRISFLLIMAMVIPFSHAQTTKDTLVIDAHQKLARDIFRELVEINTTVTIGCTRAAEAMAARLRKAGFRESEIKLVGPQPQHMNLVVHYQGKGVLPPVLFIGHLDVVEALPQDWSMDPFKFMERDGYFYGRGTLDMKCDDASLIANLIRLRQEGFVPDRDIIVALTEDEESGDANGIEWLLNNRRDLINAEYCINPDGGGGDIKNGRETAMSIQTSEKIYLDYSFEVHNKGGHSSLPVRENAIYRLAGALTRLSDYDFPIALNETTRMYFERHAAQESGQTKADMLAMATVLTDMAAANRLAASSPNYNSNMRTTCVATMLNGGHAQNALPQTARANINCRMLPGENPDSVLATLSKVVADSLVTITCTYASIQGPLSPIRKDILETVDLLTASMWPGAIVTPSMSTGASDGRFLRRAGMPVYGVSGMFIDVEDIRAHGRDERIGVKEFYNGVEFMYRFMKTLTSGR